MENSKYKLISKYNIMVLFES